MKKYDSYKDSGIEWIGEIPSHWEKRRIKYSYDLIMGQSPNSEDCNITGEGIPFLQGNADFGAKHPFPKNWCTKPSKIAPTNSILLSVRAPIGEVNLANQEYCIGRGLCALTTENPKYLYYISLCLHDELNSLGTGSTFKAISTEQILNTSTVIPTLQEQTSIANFLDIKTSEIDEIIADKKRLLELYEEEKTAIINQAVTKGLDPNAPMKDSGIEWLGEIPEHWEVLPIKYVLLIPLTDGPHETPNLYQEGIPFISAEAIKGDKIDFSKMRGYISQKDHDLYSKKYKPQKGDVYMIKSGATTGNLARVETDEEFNIWSPLAAFRPNPKLTTTDFMFYYMKSASFFTAVKLGWNYGTQQNIGMNVLENLRIVKPPIKEQQSIVQHIESECSKIDFKKARTEELIELLTEYRTALISEAVTGKIKVTED